MITNRSLLAMAYACFKPVREALSGSPRCFSRAVAACVLGACALGGAAPVRAQTSRAAVIAEEQATKAVHLGREGPSRLERVLVRAEESPLFGRTSGFYPWLGGVYPGTSLAAGAGYVERMADGKSLNGAAALSVQGSWLVKGTATLPEIAGGLARAELSARHAVARDLAFYGIGASSALASPARYDYRATVAGATAALRPARNLILSGEYHWLSIHSTARAAAAPAAAAGLDLDLGYNTAQAGAALDWRPAPAYSTHGGLQQVIWSVFREAHGRPYSFQMFQYEAVQLVPLLREQYVIAVRGLVTLTRTEGRNKVPFVLAPTLGGGETLRGFATRRFTDRARLLVTGEYRWRPSRWLDMAIFVDAGEVAARAGDFALAKLESDVGLGARFHGPSFLVLRADLARSHEGWGLALAVGKEVL